MAGKNKNEAKRLEEQRLVDKAAIENKEAENKEAENKEAENKEAENKEAENKEAENKEAENKEENAKNEKAGMDEIKEKIVSGDSGNIPSVDVVKLDAKQVRVKFLVTVERLYIINGYIEAKEEETKIVSEEQAIILRRQKLIA